MLKNILNLKGIEKLNKTAQKGVNGGTLHTNCDDIQGCQYGGFYFQTGSRWILSCCAGSPDN